MNLNLITYEDKEQINVNADIPAKNKCMASDLNEIKNALNTLIVPKLLNIFYPIGSYYETSDISFDPNISMGGTWELETDGTVLVSKSSTTGSKFNASIGNVVGEETHTLTTQELASHNHTGTTNSAGNHSHTYKDYYNAQYTSSDPRLVVAYNSDTAGTGVSTNEAGLHQHTFTTNNSGGNQPHNNIQPSKIVNRWHRTA